MANNRNECEVSVNYQDGWNFISLPVDVDDSNYQSLFPNSIEGTLYSFTDNVYNVETEMIAGHGYWLFFNAEGLEVLTGECVSSLVISMNEGWNMVATGSYSVTISDIEDLSGIITEGAFYGFDGNYFTPVILEPGQGYWIRANSTGFITISSSPSEDLSALHSSIVFKDIPEGTFTMGEAETNYQGPPGSYDAYIHTVTLSAFQMSETEITNEQYAHFLNGAYYNGLVEVQLEINPGPNMGDVLVYGTDEAPGEYAGMAIYNLSGTRVMKDHDNADGDDNPFTGEIEPENPLNIAYIGFDELNESNGWFSVKDPTDPNDFDWMELTNYYNYTTVSHQEDTTILLNDFYDWEELADYPNNLPTVLEVSHWPATFIKWYGAKAFTLFYDIDLPTEAQWEYAAQAGEEFIYATEDGNVHGDGTSANWNHLGETPSRGHVLDVQLNEPNPYGLYNMAGNVWEWIEDWYATDFYIDTDGATDPVNTTNTGFKVRRGVAPGITTRLLLNLQQERKMSSLKEMIILDSG
jgi:formylglycine-generating enzyme required for sulfatase activity|tara:strand:- start:1259 stop:2827 length:1569 start_codon:yes stop_codon:yes gene_type:complete